MQLSIKIIFVVALFFVACKKENNLPSQQVNDLATNINDTIGIGQFTGYDHGLKGSAILYKDSSGKSIIRLENYTMTSGPDVFLYLSTGSTYSPSKVISVAKLTAGYIGSDINFPVDDSNYTKDHKYVLVYCKQFSSLFGNALLQ